MSAQETSQATSQDTATAPLVTVDGLHTYYGKSHILHGVSLTVGRGEVVGLLGRNGVGKSKPTTSPLTTVSDTPCRMWLLP